jgi:hypothetical protein
MEFYSCTVKLSGSEVNQVFKPKVSAPEVLLLKFIHGGAAEGEGVTIEAIKDITLLPKETKTIDHGVERARLKSIYPAKHVDAVFGSAQHGPLPTQVDGAIRPDMKHKGKPDPLEGLSKGPPIKPPESASAGIPAGL